MQHTVPSPSASERGQFKQGVIDCLPTLFGYVGVGAVFGIVGASSGLSLLEISLISVLIYAGSAQFILCALLLTSTPASVIIFTIFIVNLRHLLMSLTVAPHFTRYSMLRNIGFGSLLTDETFGVAVTESVKGKTLNGRWMDGLNLTAYASWVASCIAGACLGQWVSQPEQWGLDFAITAMFVALLVMQLHSSGQEKLFRYLRLILCMVVVMYGLMYVVPSHLAILLATVIVATIGAVTEP